MTRYIISNLITYPIIVVKNNSAGELVCHFVAQGNIDSEGEPSIIKYNNYMVSVAELANKDALKYFYANRDTQTYNSIAYKYREDIVSAYANYADEVTPEVISAIHINTNMRPGYYILVADDVRWKLGLVHKKYVLCAHENGHSDVTTYDTYEDAYKAMLEAYEFACKDIPEEYRDDFHWYCSDYDALVTYDYATSTWDIFEVCS